MRTDTCHDPRVDICQVACVCERAEKCVCCVALLFFHLACVLSAVGDVPFVALGNKAINHVRCLPQTCHAAPAARCLTLSVPGCSIEMQLTGVERESSQPGVGCFCVCALNILCDHVCTVCEVISMDMHCSDKLKIHI